MSAPHPPVTALGPHSALAHVSLEIEMLGNFDEKSLARCAIFTAIWRGGGALERSSDSVMLERSD